MRVTARWEFFDAPPTHCSNCGTKLVPFLPDCRRCGTPAPARTGEVEVPESGALEKPTGAIRVAHLSDLHIGQNVPATKLKPIAVLLPPLLGWFKKNSPKKLRGKTLEDLPSEERQAREQFSRLQELVISLVCHWAPIATKPGYGWWELAAHLTGANLNPAAAAVTTRALSSYGEPSTATRDFVMGKLLTWAIKQEDRVVMLRWLEHGERIYGA